MQLLFMGTRRDHALFELQLPVLRRPRPFDGLAQINADVRDEHRGPTPIGVLCVEPLKWRRAPHGHLESRGAQEQKLGLMLLYLDTARRRRCTGQRLLDLDLLELPLWSSDSPSTAPKESVSAYMVGEGASELVCTGGEYD